MGTVRQDAEKEVKEEQTKSQIATYKVKLAELRDAKKIVKNIEKEIEALDDKFEQDNG